MVDLSSHWIIELLRCEGTPQGLQSCSKGQIWECTRLLRALSSWVWKTSQDGDCTTSLGNCFHGLLTVTKVLLINSLEQCQPGVSRPQVRGSAFVLDDFRDIPFGPFPRHVQVSLDGSPPLHHVTCTPKLVSSAKVLSSQLSVTYPGPLLRTLNRTSPTAQACSAPLLLLLLLDSCYSATH